MHKILKIFLALVLAVLMTVEVFPVNTVRAEDDEVPVTETAEPVDTAAEEENQDNDEVEAEVTEAPAQTEEEETPEPAEVLENEEPAEAEEPEVSAEPLTKKDFETAEGLENGESADATVLNAESFFEEYTVGDLKVTVAFEAGIVPEGTEVVVDKAKQEAIDAIKAEKEEDLVIKGADISFVCDGKEIEPKDFSDKKVTVTLSYVGKEDMTGFQFETIHVKETLNEEGKVIYGAEPVEAVMTPVTVVTEVPYEYTWTTTEPNYKKVPVYGDVEVEYEEEVPVYETREITEKQMVTKTREVEKTRLVKVKVDVVWWDPTTWLGYKYVIETYTATETYEEEETVVVGYEEVLVGTKTETKTRTEQGIVDYEIVEDGTVEVEHSETRTREEEIIIGQTAVFEANDFSTYTITGSDRNVTVNYGYLDENNAFVLFSSQNITSTSTSYPASGLSYSNYNGNNRPYAYLVYDFPDYTYKETRRGSTTGTKIWPILRLTSESYRYRWQYIDYSETELFYYDWLYRLQDNFDTFGSNNNNVYVIYEKKVVTTGSSSSGGGQGGGDEPEVPELPAGKSVEPNGDGTYNVTLSVTGVEKESAEITRASVIVVFDTSGSMEWNMAGEETSVAADQRLNIAKNAVKELANTLLDITDPKTGEHLVQMALITFDTGSQIKSFTTGHYTVSKDEYNGVVDNINIRENGTGATNWEAALLNANSLEVASNAPTYVIFVSDGDPTFRVSRLNDTNAFVTDTVQTEYNSYGDTLLTQGELREGYFGTGGAYIQGHYNAALNVAKEIVAANKQFYTIGVSTAASRMENLADAATNTQDHYFAGIDTTTLTDAFSKIAKAVRENLGFTEVQIDDGVTELTTVETNALTGKPENFVYRKGTNGEDPTQNALWSDAPQATITDDNHVIWDVKSIGQLEAGVTYSVTFTVWPSQESYNIIADINNGIIRNTDGTINRTGTPAEAYAAQPADVQEQIVIVGNVYTLKTNTGANISYKYNGEGGGSEVTVKKEGSMPLDTSYFGITKDWQNLLPRDSRTASVLTKKDESDGKTYLINSDGEWILKDGERIEFNWSTSSTWRDLAVYYIDLIITKGDEEYTEVRLYSDKEWKYDQMFIAPGVITHSKEASSGSITIRETGDEYTVKEKPSDSYYWELFAEVYHPMVINGVSVVLQEVVEDAPEMENNTFNGNYYKFGNKVYKKLGSADDAVISAINNRRSYLNITKELEGENAPDTIFTYNVKITIPNAKHSNESGFDVNLDPVWFSVFVDNAVYKDLEVSDNVHAEMSGDEPTGYFWVDSGESFTVKMKAGWNFRSSNLLSNTTYEISESESTMDPGFVFKKVEPSAVTWTVNGNDYIEQEVDYSADEINGATIKGTIKQPNTGYTVTYTNAYLGVFYVYHSASKTVERFPMAVNGVAYSTDNPFDIHAQTGKYFTGAQDEVVLYGGYYSDYAGKSEGYDSTSMTYDSNNIAVDTNGNVYSYQYIADSGKAAWTKDFAYTTDGKAMVPARGYTYFLKEVPESYLLPYTHYTYYKASKKLAAMISILAVDDLNYENAGFIVESENKTAKIVTSLKVKAANGSATTTLTANKVYKTKGVLDGYLGYSEITSYIKVNSEAVVKQFWETPDGIEVFGTTQRTLQFNDGTITGLKKVDSPVELGND